MKPDIIFLNESDGKVTLTKEELKDLIDKAYYAGKAENGTITTPYNPTQPYWIEKSIPTTTSPSKTYTLSSDGKVAVTG